MDAFYASVEQTKLPVKASLYRNHISLINELLAQRDAFRHLKTIDVSSDGDHITLQSIELVSRFPGLNAVSLTGCRVSISRSEQRPDCQVYHWTLRQALPTLPAPLRRPDVDIQIDSAQCSPRFTRGRSFFGASITAAQRHHFSAMRIGSGLKRS